jgi:hypothetical protein
MMTAWGPLIPVISAIAEKYQCDTHMEYYEGGMAFRGIATAKWLDSGVLTEDESWNMTGGDFRELGLL